VGGRRVPPPANFGLSISGRFGMEILRCLDCCLKVICHRSRYEFPVLAVSVMALFLLGNVLRSTLFALFAWLVTSPEHGAPQREQLRLAAWSLCWHGAAVGLALHSMQPMCTTADNKDDVELPEGLTRAGCEEAGHKYQPGLAPLLGPTLAPMQSLHSSWGTTTSSDEELSSGSNTLAAALLGQHGASDWPAQRVPIRVHALYIWQMGAVVERALGWALGDYTLHSITEGIEVVMLTTILGLAYTSGNACAAVAWICAPVASQRVIVDQLRFLKTHWKNAMAALCAAAYGAQ
jgi:hypothetical protein